ncbi:MAG: hypothetical protein IPG53_23735 [Ignavibacteriales bacterium]|nr:hypothetical protein [Ignavibacteriales bacterium]
MPHRNPEEFQPVLLNFAFRKKLKGKIYLAFEGINGSVSGDHKKIELFKSYIQSFPFISEVIFKEDPFWHLPRKNVCSRKEKARKFRCKGYRPEPWRKRLSPEGLLKLYEEGKNL